MNATNRVTAGAPRSRYVRRVRRSVALKSMHVGYDGEYRRTVGGKMDRRFTASVASAAILGSMMYLSACGASDSGKSARDDTGEKTESTSETTIVNEVSYVPEGPAVDFGVNIVPSDDMKDSRLTSITSYHRTGLNGDEIFIQFPQDSGQCLAAKADVLETDSSVRVSLHTGTPTDADDIDCGSLGTLASLKIKLNSPLADRSVVQ